MTEPTDFESVLVEWRLRHHVADNDPMMAALELLKAFFQNAKIELPPDSDAIRLVEETLDFPHQALKFNFVSFSRW